MWTARRLALAPVVLVMACSAPDARLERSQRRAESYFATHVRGVDPGWAGLLGYLHRRFGLSLRDADGTALHEMPGGSRRPETAAIYRRLAEPDASVSQAQIAALDSATDRMTALALHCDRIGLPPDWPDVLRRAGAAGGYALTHAALASEWTLENECRPFAEVAPVQHEIVERLVGVARLRGGPESGVRAPTDLFLEAMAMLYYVRAGTRVEPAWIEAMLETQRPDGGWPLRPDAPVSDPHPTALALWVLLENLQPAAPPIRWIP